MGFASWREINFSFSQVFGMAGLGEMLQSSTPAKVTKTCGENDIPREKVGKKISDLAASMAAL